MPSEPWTFHADCLRDGAVEAPPGPHELLLVMRDSFDLLGPGPGQVFRLVPGVVLFAAVESAADATLANHLSASRTTSAFRYALTMMLRLVDTDEIESAIDEWIDAHVAVALLPVSLGLGGRLPASRYRGFLDGFQEVWETEHLH